MLPALFIAMVYGALAQDAPSHAGCFVKNGTTMLAVKLTYDGNLFDIPGGRTDGHEPATRTAERETFEESGYQVSIGELLATVRGGFRIYNCYLQGSSPRKGPDHEVSMVKWMDVGEIEGHLQHHEWRFQEDQAVLYLDWLVGEHNHNRRLSIHV
ncbi:Nudix hydrolase domain-containing protein [Durusdinium trenchii]|uniref:Nudix hydrolase domain-containing protein n=1 Tax=Durusdinium trenchii TaxID=1381693 RepID=A0ABP0L2J1_9DINO